MWRVPANDWLDDAESIAMGEKHRRKQRKSEDEAEPPKCVCYLTL
jgi:hypothetical protein